MLKHLSLVIALATASPAVAGIDEALDTVLLPGVADFAAASAALAEAAQVDCTPPALTAPYDATWAAWLNVGGFLLGPTDRAKPHIAFWPDARGSTPKTLKSLIAAESLLIDDAQAFAEVSIAGKGLFALERLLFDPAFADYGAESYTCRLVQAVADDLAAQARRLDTAWRDDYAPTLKPPARPAMPFSLMKRWPSARSTPRSCKCWNLPPTARSGDRWAASSAPGPNAPRPSPSPAARALSRW